MNTTQQKQQTCTDVLGCIGATDGSEEIPFSPLRATQPERNERPRPERNERSRPNEMSDRALPTR